MKALSITQPFASLIAIGAKTIETRSFQTRYRGPLAIHASKGWPTQMQELSIHPPFRQAIVGNGIAYRDLSDARGHIIAVCNLVDCIRMTADNLPDEPERSFGDYREGRWMWMLSDVRRVAPVPAKGQLGIWNWEGELG